MKNILITGSNGLIGAELVSQLKLNTNLNIYGAGHTISTDKNFIQIDFNTDWDDRILPNKMDIVIHLSQSEKFRDFPDSAKEVLNVNTISTIKLLDYARRVGVKKFVYASSGGVYGNSDIGFNEESPLHLNKDLGFYLATKFCSELLVENYAAFFEVNILRFFFAFGERQRKDMLIPRLVNLVKNKKPIVLQGNEGININPIYVEDAAKAITKLIDKEGSYNINIGGAEIISIKKICEIIGDHLSVAPIFEYHNAEVKNLIGDISKMKEFYNPSVTMKDALKKMTL